MLARDIMLPLASASVLAASPAMQQAADATLSVPGDLKAIVEYGLGYLLVMVLLVPLVRWVLSSVISSQKERDQMLHDMVENLRNATRSMDQTVQAFRAFELQENEVHRAIIARLEGIERAIKQ